MVGQRFQWHKRVANYPGRPVSAFVSSIYSHPSSQRDPVPTVYVVKRD